MAHRHFGPSKLYYLLTLAGFAATYFAGQLFLERRTAEITAGLTRGAAPGEFRVVLPSTGHYAVYLEHQGLLGNQLFVTGQDLGLLECTLSTPSGQGVELRQPLWPLSYHADSRQGLQVLEFHAPEAGAYALAGAYPAGKVGPRLLLAVGEGLLGDLSSRVLGAVALALAPALGGLVVGSFIWRARLKARRRLYGRHA